MLLSPFARLRRLSPVERKLLGIGLPALAAALVLAGCGPSSASGAQPGTEPTVPGVETGIPQCGVKELKAHLVKSDSHDGGGTLTLRTTNESKTTCSLTGSPFIELVNSGNYVIGSGGGHSSTAPPSTLTVAPKASAYLDVSYRIKGASGKCAPMIRVELTLPGQTETLREALAGAPDIRACQFSDFEVSPLRETPAV